MPSVRAASITCNDSDEHILRRIAGAVIFQWDELPKDVQDLILEQAPFMLDRHETVQLAQQIRGFIEKRKGGK